MTNKVTYYYPPLGADGCWVEEDDYRLGVCETPVVSDDVVEKIESAFHAKRQELALHHRTVFVYSGDGADLTSAMGLVEQIKSFDLQWKVESVDNPQDLFEESLTTDAQESIYVLGGGSATKYEAAFNNEHMFKILNNKGAAFLGVCAGAFRESRRSIYNITPTRQLIRERENYLFPGTSKGPKYTPIDWQGRLFLPFERNVSTESPPPSPLTIEIPVEHRIAKIKHLETGLVGEMLCSGGGSYIPSDEESQGKTVKPLLVYDDGIQEEYIAAAAFFEENKGPCALMMPHSEYSFDELEHLLTDPSVRVRTPSTAIELAGVKSPVDGFRRQKSFGDFAMASVLEALVQEEK